MCLCVSVCASLPLPVPAAAAAAQCPSCQERKEAVTVSGAPCGRLREGRVCAVCALCPGTGLCPCASPSVPVLVSGLCHCGGHTHCPTLCRARALTEKEGWGGQRSAGAGRGQTQQTTARTQGGEDQIGGTRRLRVELHEYYPLMPSAALYLFSLVHGVASNRLQRICLGRTKGRPEGLLPLLSLRCGLPLQKWRWLCRSRASMETGGVEGERKGSSVLDGVSTQQRNANKEQNRSSSRTRTAIPLVQYCWYPSSTC
jgi:hypothetical protein